MDSSLQFTCQMFSVLMSATDREVHHENETDRGWMRDGQTRDEADAMKCYGRR